MSSLNSSSANGADSSMRDPEKSLALESYDPEKHDIQGPENAVFDEASDEASDPEKTAPSSPVLQPVATNATETSANYDPTARPACFSSVFTEVLFVITVTMAIAMSSFLAGGITVITSYVGTDLDMNNAAITWLEAAPSLASGAFLLPFGKIADLFGRKPLFVASLLAFAALSVGAGFARSGIVLDTIVGLMGFTSAAAVPAAVGSLGSVYKKPSRRKNWAFACFSAGNPLGFVFGTLYSGVATQIFSWRASFYFLAMIFAVITIIAFFTVPGEKAPQRFSWNAIKSFDFVGTVLTIAGIGMLSTALTNGTDAPQGWRTPYILALLIVGIALLVIFVWWETRFPEPLMPMHIWLDRDFSLLNIIQALTFAGFNAGVFWIALFFQRVWAPTPLSVALYLLPMAIMGIIVNIVIGSIMHRVSNKLLMWFATGCYTVSFTLMALNKASYVYWALCFPSFLVCVWGADTIFNVSNMYIMSSLPKSEQSVAGGIFQCIIRLSSTVGLGITTAIFDAVQRSPPRSGYYAMDASAPYASAIWFAVGICGISLVFVPFLRITTQGHS